MFAVTSFMQREAAWVMKALSNYLADKSVDAIINPKTLPDTFRWSAFLPESFPPPPCPPLVLPDAKPEPHTKSHDMHDNQNIPTPNAACNDRYKFICNTPFASDDEEESENSVFFARPVPIASGMTPAPLVGHSAHDIKCILKDEACNLCNRITHNHKSMHTCQNDLHSATSEASCLEVQTLQSAPHAVLHLDS